MRNKRDKEMRCGSCHKVIMTAVCSWWIVHQNEDGRGFECPDCYLKRYEHDLLVEIEKRKLLERIIMESINR